MKLITSNELQDELIQINEKLNRQNKLFDLAEDDDLIEAIIYEQKALQLRYDYLIKKARRESLNMSFIDRKTFERQESL
jgi:hypothetical protein